MSLIEKVALKKLKPHPSNARLGDVDAIAESLSKHGQYRPIVASVKTRHVLAGHHVLQAATKLGWTELEVSWVDVDAQGELKILLADNRTSDLASYNEPLLQDLLGSLESLEGSGFTEADKIELDRMIEEGFTDAPLPNPEPNTDEKKIKVSIAHHKFVIQEIPYALWREGIIIQAGALKLTPQKYLRSCLMLPEIKPVEKQSPPEIFHSTQSVRLAELRVYPDNPREGDIGAISESLRVNGQYRPIVVNKKNNQVLVGNHTFMAAKALGWEEMSATFVDVDEEEARKIVLVDNRTSDLGRYSDDGLRALLKQVNSYEGTGFTPEDVADLMDGARGKPSYPVGRSTARIGEWSIRVSAEEMAQWLDIGYKTNEVIGLLGLSVLDCEMEDY
jgi:ParB-like chromosome segregation protein Spo0J